MAGVSYPMDRMMLASDWEAGKQSGAPEICPMLYDNYRYDGDRVYWRNGWYGGCWDDWPGPVKLIHNDNAAWAWNTTAKRHPASWTFAYYDGRAETIFINNIDRSYRLDFNSALYGYGYKYMRLHPVCR